MKLWDVIFNALQVTFGFFSNNIPLLVAGLATALSWFDETGKTIGDIFGFVLTTFAHGLSYLNDNALPFFGELITSISSFTSIWYPKINAYFPLDFLLSAMSIYIGTRCVGIVIRTVKSFIPTISG